MLTFSLVLLGFLAVGWAAARRQGAATDDYYLASRSLPPWLVGLSAVATNNSGYMFIGVIGFTYQAPLDALYLMVGWLAGDALATARVHGALQRRSHSEGARSYLSLLLPPGASLGAARMLASIALAFLVSYCAAQLLAGAKALGATYGLGVLWGVLIGAVLIGFYSFAGGLRASIWTDAAQSVVMMGAMGALLWAAYGALPPGALEASLPSSPFPRDALAPNGWGLGLFVLGWGFAGASVLGQPHVMVRFMTLAPEASIVQTRLWYYLWFCIFYCLASAVGLLSRAFFAGAEVFDPELAMPRLAVEVLPAGFEGVLLAGVFAATLSTADSLLLGASAALTQDAFPQLQRSKRAAKSATLSLLGLACLLAWAQPSSVFQLVVFSWSGLASAFAPLLIARLAGWRLPLGLLWAVPLAGLAAAVLWRLAGWHTALYEGAPGMLLGLALLYLGRGSGMPRARRHSRSA